MSLCRIGKAGGGWWRYVELGRLEVGGGAMSNWEGWRWANGGEMEEGGAGQANVYWHKV